MVVLSGCKLVYLRVIAEAEEAKTMIAKIYILFHFFKMLPSFIIFKALAFKFILTDAVSFNKF